MFSSAGDLISRACVLRLLGARVLAAFLLCACVLGIGPFADSAWAGDLGGSVRAIVAVLDDSESEFLSQGILRVTAVDRPKPWLRYQVHGVQTLTYTTADDGTSTGSPFSSSGVRYRAFDLNWDWLTDSRTSATLALDRAAATIRMPRADLTIGRQAISFGKTYFWNILDVFLPFDPEQFDRDYKPGVDAVRLDVSLGIASGFNFVAVAGPTVEAAGSAPRDKGFTDASWFGSAVLARAFTNYRGWDLAVQGGKVFGGYHLGVGVVGELGPLESRLEFVRHFADDSPPLVAPVVSDTGDVVQLFDGDLIEDSTSMVVGTGHRFENSFTIEAEYFHNGAGDSDATLATVLRSSAGGLLNLTENLAGVSFSYELTPLVLATLGSIVALDDGSFQLLPTVNWSAGDELELLAGAVINSGNGGVSGVTPQSSIGSEFGVVPSLFFTELKYYF